MQEIRWYRKKDLCRIFRVARPTIDRWAHSKKYAHLRFPKPRKLPGTEILFWLASEVDGWAQEHESMRPVELELEE